MSRSTLPDDEALGELFTRIAAGGDAAHEAMDELCRATFRHLCGFFGTMGFDRAEAEDLVQEVYLRILKAGDLGSIRMARGWLYLVARRLAIDAFRRRGPLLYDAGAAAEDQVGPGAHDTAAWRDADIDVQRALEILRQRNPEWFLALHCAAAGLSGRELAEVLGRDREGTANQLLSEARQALREIYAKLTGERGPRKGPSLPS